MLTYSSEYKTEHLFFIKFPVVTWYDNPFKAEWHLIVIYIVKFHEVTATQLRAILPFK